MVTVEDLEKLPNVVDTKLLRCAAFDVICCGSGECCRDLFRSV